MGLHLKNLLEKPLMAVVISVLGGLIGTAMPSLAQQELVLPTARPTVSPYQTSEQLNELLEEGRKLVSAGNLTDAIAFYEQAATLEPRNPQIYAGIGYLQARQGNFAAAVAAYRRAISIAPQNPKFQYALGYSLANTGDNLGAEAAYRRAIQFNRKDVNAYMGLGVVLFRQGKYQDAMSIDQKALAIAPKFGRAYELKGAILKQLGHRKEAIAAISNARILYQRQGYTLGVERAKAMLQELQP